MSRTIEPQGIVETKTAPKRTLKFNCMNCLKAELDRIDEAHRQGAITTTGNWSPGQIFSHCAIFFRCSLDGFPSLAPAPVRFFAKLLFKKKALSGEPMPSGFQLPRQASFMLPAPDVTFEQGMTELREQISRIDAGEKMTQTSPLLGELSHEEWVRLHLAHCMMHLAFIDYLGAPGSASGAA
ncbi:MAG: DUF1569 domain-containing protein [bacterium]|nr:DUF1569 domain-containing protein [bacterium]